MPSRFVLVDRGNEARITPSASSRGGASSKGGRQPDAVAASATDKEATPGSHQDLASDGSEAPAGFRKLPGCMGV